MYLILLVQSIIGVSDNKNHEPTMLTSACLVYAIIMVLVNLMPSVRESYTGTKFLFFTFLCIIYTSSEVIYNTQEYNIYKVVSIRILSLTLMSVTVLLVYTVSKVYKSYKPSQATGQKIFLVTNRNAHNMNKYSSV